MSASLLVELRTSPVLVPIRCGDLDEAKVRGVPRLGFHLAGVGSSTTLGVFFGSSSRGVCNACGFLNLHK